MLSRPSAGRRFRAGYNVGVEAGGSESGELDVETREVVIRADFDLLDEERCARVSLRFLSGPRHPRSGEIVYLLDDHGRGCVGTVEEVNGWSARVRPDWTTWTGGAVPPAHAP